MTWQDIMNTGYGASDIATFQQHGWSPDSGDGLDPEAGARPSGQAAPAAAAAPPQQDAFGITRTLRTDAQGNTALAASNGNADLGRSERELFWA